MEKRKKIILVIISDTSNNNNFRDILRQNFDTEYELFFTERPEVFVTENPRVRPLTVICDYEEMADNIAEIMTFLGKHKQMIDIPVTFCITESNLDNIADYEIYDFIKKPFNQKVLIARLKLLLKKSDLKNQLDEKNQELKDFLREKTRLNLKLSARDLALNKSAAASIMSKKGTITFINDKFCSISKYGKHELMGIEYVSIICNQKNRKEYDNIWRTIYRGEIWRGEICCRTKLNEIIWTDTTISPVYDERGRITNFFGIHFDITDRKNFEQQLKEKNENVTLSINYASRIQKALLPSNQYLKEVLMDYFVFYKPRDIVSGDFYWVKQVSHITVVALADCTGHGVPGAFMSMLGFSFLNEIVTFRNSKQPSQILNELRLLIKQSLHQEGANANLDDGMDITICSIDFNNKKMFFTGAMNCVYIVRDKNNPIIKGENINLTANENKNLFQIEGDYLAIGTFQKDSLFKTTTVDLYENDILYNFSDGYIDQFGGENNIKFTSKKFKRMLLEISKFPLNEQKEMLQTTYDNWVTAYNRRQIDDILILAVKI